MRRLRAVSDSPVLCVLVALLAVPGVFSLTSVFYVRDLATFFFPHHLWARGVLLSGGFPLWNPYLGCGYATGNDPALQTFFPPVLLLRLLPAVLGFNLIVALPIAVAALGTYRFLASKVSASAACLGSLVFAASGPILSTANMPNLAWSCALMPWVFSTVDGLIVARTGRRIACAALAFGLMLLAGEPVTFAATVAAALAYAVTFGGGAALGSAALSLAFGVLLSAVQLVPTAAITPGSIRSSGALRDMWSLHPARLFETIAPNLFGKYTGYPNEITQWLFVVNDMREPLLFSIYLGVPALLVAALGASLVRRSRQAAFWSVLGIVSVVAAFGTHTILYRLALRVVPGLALFRYPSKYLILTTMAVAVLVALGRDALASDAPARKKLAAPLALASVLCLLGLVALALVHVWPEAGSSLVARWARALEVPQVDSGVRSLLASVAIAAPRLLAFAALGAVVIWMASSRPRAGGALLLLVAGDLVLQNASINPAIEASNFEPFPWVAATRTHPDDRVFVARDYVKDRAASPEVAPPPVFPPDRPVVTYQAVYEAALGADLSSRGVFQTISREVTGLRPKEYLALMRRLSSSDREMRERFLSWAGTRYFLVMSPPLLPATRRAEMPVGSLALYESEPRGKRAFVVSSVVVEPDAEAQIGKLFEPGFDPSWSVLLERDAGPPGSGERGTAAMRESSATSVTVDADVPEGGGYLVLLDSLDPGWKVTVDGAQAEVLRADGVFRGVRLSGGAHQVRFRYAPRPLYLGALISLLTAGALGFVALRR